MGTLPLIKSSQPSVSSPDGQHVATLANTQITIRRISPLSVLRTIDLPTPLSRFLSLRWSPVRAGSGTSDRFLFATTDSVRIYDLHDREWSATIDNGSGGMGPIANVDFGFDDNEVLVFSSFGAQMTSWSLWTGRSVEIKDPKFATRGHGHSCAGRSGIFALLSRPGTQDVVSLHCAGSYEVMRSFVLPTVDAQGLKWSPDGRWMAVWDAPSSGYKIYIYTADGHLYRTYTGDYFDDELVGLGVKSIEWSRNGDFLAVGGYENSVTLLSTRTFSPAVHISHPTTLRPQNQPIYVEQASSGTTSRTYIKSQAPITPPQPPNNASTPQIGASILAFNATGTLIATKSDAHPNTIFIFDLRKLASRAAMVQLAAVRKLSWHPTNPELLLIQGMQGAGMLYLWDARAEMPKVARMPAEEMGESVEARWVWTGMGRKPVVQYGDAGGCVFGYPEGREGPAEKTKEAKGVGEQQNQAIVKEQESPAGETEEDDSLFDVLSGKKKAPKENGDTVADHLDKSRIESPNETLEDTFRYRRGVSAF